MRRGLERSELSILHCNKINSAQIKNAEKNNFQTVQDFVTDLDEFEEKSWKENNRSQVMHFLVDQVSGLC